jgi:hypothetical protein
MTSRWTDLFIEWKYRFKLLNADLNDSSAHVSDLVGILGSHLARTQPKTVRVDRHVSRYREFE